MVKKLKFYQLTVIFSIMFALIGFSYNVWRMELTEENNNIRTACFEILLTLSSLEQLVYSAHYDGDLKEGNPRKGWVKIGLINDFSVLTNNAVKLKAQALKNTWSTNWSSMSSNQSSVEVIVTAIEHTRTEIKLLLSSLN